MNIHKLVTLSTKYFIFTSLLSASKSITNLKIVQFSFEDDYYIAMYYMKQLL